MGNPKLFLYGLTLFKTLLMSFIISCSFLSKVSAETGADLLEIKNTAYADESEWQNFLEQSSYADLIFEGKTTEVRIVPIGLEFSLTALPMLSFDNTIFLKGKNLTDKTFPMPGQARMEKLQPGGEWFVILRRNENSNRYEITKMCSSTPLRKKDLIERLASSRQKSLKPGQL